MPITDYTDLENEIDDAQEPKYLPAGTEAKIRIVSVRTGISDKNDCTWYQPVFDVPDDPMVMEFNDFFWELDREKLSTKQFARALSDFQRFAKAIELDYSRPFDWEDDLVGKECWAILGVKKDDTYGDGNTVKKYIIKR